MHALRIATAARRWAQQPASVGGQFRVLARRQPPTSCNLPQPKVLNIAPYSTPSKLPKHALGGIFDQVPPDLESSASKPAEPLSPQPESFTALENLTSDQLLPISDDALAQALAHVKVALTPKDARALAALGLQCIQNQLAAHLLSSHQSHAHAPRLAKAYAQAQHRMWQIVQGNSTALYRYAGVLLRASLYGKQIAVPLFHAVAGRSNNNDAKFSYYTMLLRYPCPFYPDRHIALNELKTLARKGHASSQIELATIYIERQINLPDAVHLLTKAAQNNQPMANVKLGDIHRQGTGVEKDALKAKKYYENAVEQDHARALQYFTQAAAKGVPEAQHNVAVYHMEGNTVPRNPILASEYFKMAASAGFPFSMLNLAKLYSEGELVTADYGQAERWLRLAVATQPSLEEQALPLMRAIAIKRRREKIRALLGKRVLLGSLAVTIVYFGFIRNDAELMQSMAYLVRNSFTPGSNGE
ncbi:hypothetical protein H4R34_003834 [Dimargaris verticillata]|uniref:Uncharacterized protein n=1 Tax=Dimargaris verticillata TaxID=2761393 RepID=A0A9W8E8P8_9FUNG|nr:hypothetical protein H4R34_003834 [Dimargaris verticillata]